MAEYFLSTVRSWFSGEAANQPQQPQEQGQTEEEIQLDEQQPEQTKSIEQAQTTPYAQDNAAEQRIEAQQVSLEDSNMANYGGKEMRDLRYSAALTEKEFANAGTKVGLEIWRVENMPGKFGVKRWPKDQYGHFFSGDSYILLNTYKIAGSDSLRYDIHFWLGKDSSQDEIGVAAYKTVELDDLLRDLPIQHREVQGHESSLFRSYFTKSGIMYMEGGHESGFRHVKALDFGSYKRLFMIKREIKGWKVKTALCFEIPCLASNMNHGDVFVLDLGSKLYVWIGQQASSFEKFEANLVANNIVNSRNGKTKRSLIDDLFWQALNGTESDIRSAENPYEVEMAGDAWLDPENVKVYRISDESGSIKFSLEAKGKVSMKVLDTNDVFLVHSSVGIWIWEGSNSTKQEKEKGFLLADGYIKDNNLSPHLPITRIKEEQTKYSPLFHALFVGEK